MDLSLAQLVLDFMSTNLLAIILASVVMTIVLGGIRKALKMGR